MPRARQVGWSLLALLSLVGQTSIGPFELTGSLVGGSAAHAQGTAQPKPKTKPTPKPAAPAAGEPVITTPSFRETGSIEYTAPEKATAEELLDFLDRLRQVRPAAKSREEMIEHAIKVQNASIEVGTRILAMDMIDDDLAAEAAEMKFGALQVLAANNIGDALQQGISAAQELSTDKREEVARTAQEAYAIFRLLGVPNMSAEELQAYIKETLEQLTVQEFSRPAVMMAVQLGSQLENAQDDQVAAEYFNALVAKLEEGKPANAQELIDRFKGTARRLGLSGNEMDVFGTTMDGKPFDWKQYQGKTVLVDFWATWCGPCIDELPNVKRNYDAYHARGFEVVGISLDDDVAQLEEFLKENEIAWTTLFPDKEAERGWNNPLARHYGISGIPTAILVGPDGKVITTNARGTILDVTLEKLYPAEK